MVQILLVAIANKPTDVTWKQKAEKHQGKKSKKNKNNKKKNLFGSYNNPFVPYLRLMLLILSLPQVTKTEFLITIWIQYQAGRWWE